MSAFVFASQNDDERGNRDSGQRKVNILPHDGQHPDDCMYCTKDEKINERAGDMTKCVKVLCHTSMGPKRSEDNLEYCLSLFQLV